MTRYFHINAAGGLPVGAGLNYAVTLSTVLGTVADLSALNPPPAPGQPDNRCWTGPHLHFEIRINGLAIDWDNGLNDGPYTRGQAIPVTFGGLAGGGGGGGGGGGLVPIPSKPALYRSSTATFYQRFSPTSGLGERNFPAGQAGDVPLFCDWNKDGVKTWGLYRPGTQYFYLSNDQNPGPGTPTDIQFQFGDPGDIPLCGDWDNNGWSEVGLYRPSTQFFYLRLTNFPGPFEPVLSFIYGSPGDKPIVGDWDGNGSTTIGITRQNGPYIRWFLRNSNSQGGADVQVDFGVFATDRPVAGNWDGLGGWTPGVTRINPTGGLLWLARNDTNPGAADVQFEFGNDFNDTAVTW
jgi:hypothetical protein